MEPQIIWEDNSLLVINKPPGQVVNRSETTSHQFTLQDWLNQKFRFHQFSHPDPDFAARSGIVHRLDKDTSGLLLIAKIPPAFYHLQTQFKSRQVGKTYLCLAHGQLSPSQGQITLPLGRLPWNRTRFGPLPSGRPATTYYQAKKHYQDPSGRLYTLVSVSPQTGRTHQIRVHFKSLHHPLVADDLYAGRKTARADHLWCPRLFLHAHQISFHHPVTGQPLTFTSPLPRDLKSALRHLKELAKID